MERRGRDNINKKGEEVEKGRENKGWGKGGGERKRVSYLKG